MVKKRHVKIKITFKLDQEGEIKSYLYLIVYSLTSINELLIFTTTILWLLIDINIISVVVIACK